jgi:hypothetical protein
LVVDVVELPGPVVEVVVDVDVVVDVEARVRRDGAVVVVVVLGAVVVVVAARGVVDVVGASVVVVVVDLPLVGIGMTDTGAVVVVVGWASEGWALRLVGSR